MEETESIEDFKKRTAYRAIADIIVANEHNATVYSGGLGEKRLPARPAKFIAKDLVAAFRVIDESL